MGSCQFTWGDIILFLRYVFSLGGGQLLFGQLPFWKHVKCVFVIKKKGGSVTQTFSRAPWVGIASVCDSVIYSAGGHTLDDFEGGYQTMSKKLCVHHIWRVAWVFESFLPSSHSSVVDHFQPVCRYSSSWISWLLSLFGLVCSLFFGVPPRSKVTRKLKITKMPFPRWGVAVFYNRWQVLVW